MEGYPRNRYQHVQMLGGVEGTAGLHLVFKNKEQGISNQACDLAI